MSALDEQTEVFIGKFVEHLVAEVDAFDLAMTATVRLINEGTIARKGSDALLDALAKLEEATALFRWVTAQAVLSSQHARPRVTPEVSLIIHGRKQNPLDWLEGHAMAVLELTEDMRREETRGRVLDIRQHTKKLVEFAKCLDLPRKPPERKHAR